MSNAFSPGLNISRQFLRAVGIAIIGFHVFQIIRFHLFFSGYTNTHIVVNPICPKLITRKWQGFVLRSSCVPEKRGLNQEAPIET